MKLITKDEFRAALAKKDTLHHVEVHKEVLARPVDEQDRHIKFTISTDGVDRAGDVIHQMGWYLDNYLKNPVVLWNHCTEQVIGKCIQIGIEDGDLKATVEFIPESNPWMGRQAEGIYQMCKQGFLSATSVGFFPIELAETTDQDRGAYTREPGVDIYAAELTEFSIVTKPCNPEALIETVGIKEQVAVATKEHHDARERSLRLLRVAALDL